MANAPADGKAAPQTAEEKLNVAEEKRQAGNDKFKQGDVAGAQALYEEATKLLTPQVIVEFAENESLIARAGACRLPSLLNLALCYLKKGESDACKALECCEEVLDMDPDNVKASYRKGKALFLMEEYKEAEYEFLRAYELSPKDTAIRQDLEAVRRKMRGDLKKEKETFEGLFEKSPGFASNDRKDEPAEGKKPSATADYSFLRSMENNSFSSSSSPDKEAVQCFKSGKLEDAVSAYEAALHKTAQQQEWSLHFPLWVELGRLFMDLNVDQLAIRCLNRAAGISGASEGISAEKPVRRNALLLRAICLLNEAEADPLKEVSDCLGLWLDACDRPAKGDQEGVDERIAEWRESEVEPALAADVAVAHGLMHLVHGREEAAKAFGDAILAANSAASCFGCERATATKWNMLAAVMSNRKQPENALSAYQQALVLQPHYPRALVNRGIALQSMANARSAAASFANAVELMPDWCAPLVWPMLKKAVEDDPTPDATLAEAARDESVPKLRELLGPVLTSGTTLADARSTLKSMGIKC
mmetsp:Transcript_75419/g.157237  ORF Transcript_75419/g.157237 Transcript_75419/m.157237 type:complete len:534 (+) Transcript_75419:85-1686(+)|eukprot:CAMPEP_0206448764 /NCGR_PEP_ID=MMETSP0324_2-20121206/17681_1 /ASSEMBLY_ACC=CAM_ASM_000836 /TAXON_ID=2866 /ORGANISM="Crypthecodinium cohnii, Strain Seligo" /LENGTH=533 /DNA_ID=CAMNT_0053917999 /DNA_START=79 /DNA_END=1680 /DNA_ORIENTATION=+